MFVETPPQNLILGPARDAFSCDVSVDDLPDAVKVVYSRDWNCFRIINAKTEEGTVWNVPGTRGMLLYPLDEQTLYRYIRSFLGMNSDGVARLVWFRALEKSPTSGKPAGHIPVRSRQPSRKHKT